MKMRTRASSAPFYVNRHKIAINRRSQANKTQPNAISENESSQNPVKCKQSHESKHVKRAGSSGATCRFRFAGLLSSGRDLSSEAATKHQKGIKKCEGTSMPDEARIVAGRAACFTSRGSRGRRRAKDRRGRRDWTCTCRRTASAGSPSPDPFCSPPAICTGERASDRSPAGAPDCGGDLLRFGFPGLARN